MAVCWIYYANAQKSLNQVLKEVESNNLHLQSMLKMAEADKLNNKTGLYPANPEAGFNYLWGDPAVNGNRKDLSVTQTIDFPTAYAHRSAISSLRNEQVDINYKHELLKLNHETRLLCINLIYLNSSIAETSRRMDNSQLIAEAYRSKFSSGDANILEYNKAQLDYLNAKRQLDGFQLEKQKLLAELSALNGGIPIEFNDMKFQTPDLGTDFELWYKGIEANNPDMQLILKETVIMDRQTSLSTAMALPKLSIGYMSEDLPLEKFSGVTMGITVPLWENKYAVKSAKARLIALKSIESDTKLQFYLEMKSKYATAVSFTENADEYRSGLQLINNSVLLKKALDGGEISLLEYMYELSLYYESMDQLLLLEKESNKAVAELIKFIY